MNMQTNSDMCRFSLRMTSSELNAPSDFGLLRCGLVGNVVTSPRLVSYILKRSFNPLAVN